MDEKKIDPIELRRMKLEGELDADELRERKVEAMKRAHQSGRPVLREKAKPLDPIERHKQKLAKQMMRRKEKTARFAREQAAAKNLPKHMVVIVKPGAKKPATPTRRADEGEEDFFTRRMREAREKLKGK